MAKGKSKASKSVTTPADVSSSRREFEGQGDFAPTHAPAVKLENSGDSYTGIVLKAEPYHVRDFKSKKLKEWEDGTAVMGLAVDVVNEDTGEINTLWIQGMRVAPFRAALAGAGIKGLAEGDSITITLEEITKEGKKEIPHFTVSIDPAA